MFDSSVNQFVKTAIRRNVVTPALSMLTRSINQNCNEAMQVATPAPGNQPTDLTVTPPLLSYATDSN